MPEVLGLFVRLAPQHPAVTQKSQSDASMRNAMFSYFSENRKNIF